MQLNKQQVDSILQNSPIGIDKKQILDGLIMRGYDLEGVDSNSIRQSLSVKPKETFGQDVKQDFLGIGRDIISGSQKRVDNITDIRSKVESGEKGNVAGVFQTAGQLAGAGADAIGSVFKGAVKMALTPKTEEKVKGLVTEFGQDVIQNEQVQKLVKWYDSQSEEAKANIDAIGGFFSLAAEFIGVGVAKRGATAVKEGTQKVLKSGLESVEGVAGATKKVVKDIVPSNERLISEQVSKALDLTQGDVKNIAKSTNNEVGRFLADRNLIGGNKEETVNLLRDFFTKQHKQVRDEIGKIDKTYNINSASKTKQALEQIQKQVDGVAGLEDATKEVNQLLKKKELSLNDIQRTKELLDEHFSLYKVTGDVKEGVQKEGLANLRRDIKEFIEKEVKDNNGVDIEPLNNDVATSRSTLDAIETRATRGLTRSNIRMGDLGIFGLGSVIGSPILGIGAVAAKKIIESPSIRLKIARYLDRVSDAKKLKIKNDLIKGEVPKEIIDVIENQSSLTPKAISKNTTIKNASISPKPTTSGLKVKGTIPKNSLEAQAKTMSKEEFVNAQGKPVFHGTDVASIVEKEGFKKMPIKTGVSAFGEGSYFTSKIGNAKGYGEVVKAFLKKDIKLKKVFDSDAYKVDTQKLIKEGYDGTIMETGNGNNIVIFDNANIKTKSQLEAIWNKANK